jgi:hypothetical protein
VGDRAYAALELLNAVRAVATVSARLRLDARRFAPPPPRRPGQKGRPRLVGDRLPNLTVHAADPAAVWTRLTIPRWYGERERPIEVLSQTAVWYSTGFPPVPIRWVLIRDPRGRFATQALLGTDVAADPQQVICWFIVRWQLEVTFHAVRAHLGVETQRETVGAGDPAHHAGPHGPLLARDAAGAPASFRFSCPCHICLVPDGVVRENHPDVQRCSRPCPPPVVDAHRFSDIALYPRPRKSAAGTYRPID